MKIYFIIYIYIHIPSSRLWYCITHNSWFSMDRKLLEFLTNPCDVWPADVLYVHFWNPVHFSFFATQTDMFEKLHSAVCITWGEYLWRSKKNNSLICHKDIFIHRAVSNKVLKSQSNLTKTLTLLQVVTGGVCVFTCPTENKRCVSST